MFTMNTFLLNLLFPIIAGVIVGIIGTLINRYYFRFQETTEITHQKKIIIQESSKISGTMTDYFNNKILNSRLLVPIFSFYILYVCIFLPLLWKAHPPFESPRLIYFSQARIIGHFLPDILISTNFFQWPIFITTLILYFPLSFVTNSSIRPVILFLITKTNAPITQRFIQTCQLTVFIILSAFIGTFVFYCYNTFTLKEAFTISLCLFLLLLLPLLESKK